MSMLGEPISREASSVKLILSFVRTDNTIQERTIDVTEIIGTLEKMRRRKKENKIRHQRLSCHLVIRLR